MNSPIYTVTYAICFHGLTYNICLVFLWYIHLIKDVSTTYFDKCKHTNVDNPEGGL